MTHYKIEFEIETPHYWVNSDTGKTLAISVPVEGFSVVVRVPADAAITEVTPPPKDGYWLIVWDGGHDLYRIRGNSADYWSNGASSWAAASGPPAALTKAASEDYSRAIYLGPINEEGE